MGDITFEDVKIEPPKPGFKTISISPASSKIDPELFKEKLKPILNPYGGKWYKANNCYRVNESVKADTVSALKIALSKQSKVTRAEYDVEKPREERKKYSYEEPDHSSRVEETPAKRHSRAELQPKRYVEETPAKRYVEETPAKRYTRQETPPKKYPEETPAKRYTKQESPPKQTSKSVDPREEFDSDDESVESLSRRFKSMKIRMNSIEEYIRTLYRNIDDINGNVSVLLDKMEEKSDDK